MLRNTQTVIQPSCKVSAFFSPRSLSCLDADKQITPNITWSNKLSSVSAGQTQSLNLNKQLIDLFFPLRADAGQGRQ